MADPGFRFPAVDHDLTDRYLAGELAGSPIFSPFIHHADVYSAVPDELVSGRQRVRDRDGNDACYIISAVRFAGKNKKSRKLRTIDGNPRKSYWHSEKGKIPLEGTETGGYVQDFVHAIKGTDGRPDRLGWRMKEYGISTEEHGDSHLVVCKLYRTPRSPTTASAPTSTTSAATPAQEYVAISSKKRKAADGGGYPPSARPRLTDELPPMLDQLQRIKAAMPHAPDPMEDLDGFLECYDAEYVKNLDAEAVQANKQAAQPEPEPEWDRAAPSCSFLQTTMEQESPFFYPSQGNNDAVIEEAALAWRPAAQPEPERDMEQEFHNNDAVTEEDAQPWPPVAQPESLHDELIEASSRQEQAVQPEPEPERGMEEEFPFLYPSHNNDAVTEEDTPPAAQPEEDVGMIPRCSGDVMMMSWPSYMHMMMH